MVVLFANDYCCGCNSKKNTECEKASSSTSFCIKPPLWGVIESVIPEKKRKNLAYVIQEAINDDEEIRSVLVRKDDGVGENFSIFSLEQTRKGMEIIKDILILYEGKEEEHIKPKQPYPNLFDESFEHLFGYLDDSNAKKV